MEKRCRFFCNVLKSANFLSTASWPLLLVNTPGKHLDHEHKWLFGDCSRIKLLRPVLGYAQPLLLHLFTGLLIVLVCASDRLLFKSCNTEIEIAGAKTGTNSITYIYRACRASLLSLANCISFIANARTFGRITFKRGACSFDEEQRARS